MNPKTDKLVRRTTMGLTTVAAYLLLTADYGSPNALDPIKNAILSAQEAAKDFVLGKKEDDATEKPGNTSKDNP
ncbi:hypothetical protein V2J09_005184 [Rumex salicifolius]